MPSKHGARKEDTMKTSMLMKTVAALAVGAAFPIGAFAAPPATTMTEKGVIEKVDGAKKEFALKGGYSKPVAIFDWNASTRFIENGKPTAASQLKMGERATVNYARQGKQRVATEVAISPSGKTAQQVEKTNAPRKHYTARNWLDS